MDEKRAECPTILRGSLWEGYGPVETPISAARTANFRAILSQG